MHPALPALRAVWPALLVALLASACADDGRKTKADCDSDAACDGGVCYGQQCYTACTTREDCADDEICVWKDDDGRELALCVVAADAVFEDEAGCRAAVRLGPCEEVAYEPLTRACGVQAVAGCEPRDRPGLQACNAGQVQLTVADVGPLPFTASDLPIQGALAFVADDGAEVLFYLWLKSSPEPVDVAGGHAVVLFAELPTGEAEWGQASLEGLALANAGGVIGVDTDWLQPDERAALTWTGGRPEAGATLTGTVSVLLTTVCGTALHEGHLEASFSVAVAPFAQLLANENDCLQQLSTALAFPSLKMGKVHEVSLDGAPYPTDASTEAAVTFYPDSGNLTLTLRTPGSPIVSVQAANVAPGPGPATLGISSEGEPACAWWGDLPQGLTVEPPAGDLAAGPVTGHFQGMLPLQPGSDASCSQAPRALVGSFTAAICR